MEGLGRPRVALEMVGVSIKGGVESGERRRKNEKGKGPGGNFAEP